MQNRDETRYGTVPIRSTRTRPRNGSQPPAPRLDGRTDTSGIVIGEEQVRLASGFGQTLEQLRADAGLSVAQAVTRANIGRRHWRYLVTGARRPSVDAIKTIARALAPAEDREAVEQRLAGLAGDSLREGKARQERRAANKAGHEMRRLLAKQNAEATRLIESLERAGRPVPETFRATFATAQERVQTIPMDEPGIPGHTPKRDAKPTPNSGPMLTFTQGHQATPREILAQLRNTPTK